MQSRSKNLLKPSLNWLLIFIPIVLTMEHFVRDKPVIIFLSAALAIVPVASLIVKATEQVALRTGDAIGGLLNATFVASGGKTNWYEGVQLLTIYLIFAILFFLIPGK